MKINLKPSNSSTNLSSQGGESTSEFHSWHDRRGSWLAYVLGVYLLQLIYLSLPFLSVASVWTLTLVTHNVVSLPKSVNISLCVQHHYLVQVVQPLYDTVSLDMKIASFNASFYLWILHVIRFCIFCNSCYG